jgi:hypothetical protein
MADFEIAEVEWCTPQVRTQIILVPLDSLRPVMATQRFDFAIPFQGEHIGKQCKIHKKGELSSPDKVWFVDTNFNRTRTRRGDGRDDTEIPGSYLVKTYPPLRK